jgi:hypothetical protein
LRSQDSNSDVYLEFSDVEDDYFRVSVKAHDHSASRRVYAYTDGTAIARLFADAAREWKGWVEAKVWESIEGEFRIALTSDRLGHVTVAVRVRSDPGGSDRWQLEAEIGLDAGQLEGVAKEADRLWCRGG